MIHVHVHVQLMLVVKIKLKSKLIFEEQIYLFILMDISCSVIQYQS